MVLLRAVQPRHIEIVEQVYAVRAHAQVFRRESARDFHARRLRFRRGIGSAQNFYARREPRLRAREQARPHFHRQVSVAGCPAGRRRENIHQPLARPCRRVEAAVQRRLRRRGHTRRHADRMTPPGLRFVQNGARLAHEAVQNLDSLVFAAGREAIQLPHPVQLNPVRVVPEYDFPKNFAHVRAHRLQRVVVAAVKIALRRAVTDAPVFGIRVEERRVQKRRGLIVQVAVVHANAQPRVYADSAQLVQTHGVEVHMLLAPHPRRARHHRMLPVVHVKAVFLPLVVLVHPAVRDTRREA